MGVPLSQVWTYNLLLMGESSEPQLCPHCNTLLSPPPFQLVSHPFTLPQPSTARDSGGSETLTETLSLLSRSL